MDDIAAQWWYTLPIKYYRILAKEGPLQNVGPPPNFGSISHLGIKYTQISTHPEPCAHARIHVMIV